MKIDQSLSARALLPFAQKVAAIGAEKSKTLIRRWNISEGAPVLTVEGRYQARNWTNWTQGFLYGNAILGFDMTGDRDLLELGRKHVIEDMAEHVTHIGVHDHGFNCISTYGNLRRLMREGRIAQDDWELRFYDLALKASGSIQAARWTSLPGSLGYIYSFNGSHSLFIDTIRTLRSCALAHLLGQSLHGEQDCRINLLDRLIAHLNTTVRYNIYYGEGRDRYDTPESRGRTVHEAVFNPASGAFRCPSTQQGYSPFSTWTRGLAWAMLGTTEQLEFLRSLGPDSSSSDEKRHETVCLLERAASAVCEFYITEASASDGICYWDAGAPSLYRLGDWRIREADPFNLFEPVDASASAIAAQGLLRLGHMLGEQGRSYTAAGLTIAKRLFEEPYLSAQPDHEGILLHSIYHHPNGWDYICDAARVPHGESSMWGDYHLLELALLIMRISQGSYYRFF
jgi:unsaturated chondroitin disaccharide hydrolase